MNQTDFSLGFRVRQFFSTATVPHGSCLRFALHVRRSHFDNVQTSGPAGSAYAGFLDFVGKADPTNIGQANSRSCRFLRGFSTRSNRSIPCDGQRGLASFRLTPCRRSSGCSFISKPRERENSALPADGYGHRNPFTDSTFLSEPKTSQNTGGRSAPQDVWWYLAGEYGGDCLDDTRATWAKTRAVGRYTKSPYVSLGMGPQRFLIRAGHRTAFH